jgi:CSLREA domain-containing protein
MRLAVLLFALLLAAPAQAVVFTVDSTVDAVDAVHDDGICADESGACTLRAAIQETNALPGAGRSAEAPRASAHMTHSGCRLQSGCAG